jgi:phenylpropionate dioxygenase-like ring-hydroxylating dioxygenase large terminal subunit
MRWTSAGPATSGLESLGWDLDEARKLGVTATRDLYRSEELLRAERERLFARSWALVGTVEELAETGSYLTVDVGGVPLVVVRGAGGVIRAFHNFCRHRGITLLEGSGTTGRHVTCPYHQWSFALDGRLLRVPQAAEQFPGLELSAWPLRPAQLATWHGMILVNPSTEAPDLASAMAGLDDRIANFFVGPMVEVARVGYEAACNWKLLLENHVDVYHLWYLHQRTLSHYDHRKFAWRSYGDNWWSTEPHKDPSGIPSGLPWLGAEERDGIGAFALFPNLMMVTTSETFSTYDAVPLAVDRTRLTLRVRARAGTDGRPLVEGIRAFLAEDLEGCRRLQEGAGSPEFDLGPMASTHEEPIRRFHASLRRALLA